MTRYEEQFYWDFKQFVSIMKEISKDLKEVSKELKEIKVEMTPHSQVNAEENKAEFNSSTYTYGEVCKMKEEFEKAREFANTQRIGEERNDK